MSEFRMPSLGADMTEGVLLEWLVHPGDTVHKGDIVAVVDTAKAAVEVECFDSGVVNSLLVTEGTRVPVGTPLATIQTMPGSAQPTPAAPPTANGPTANGRTHAAKRKRGVAKQPAGTATHAGHLVTSPLVRRLAQRYHLDTDTVPGTGAGGRVTRSDIERAAAAQDRAVAPADQTPDQARRLRISPLARKLAAELAVDPNALVGTGPGGAISAGDVRRAAAAAAEVAPSAEPVAAPSAEPVAAPSAEPVAAPNDRAGTMRATIAAAMTRSKQQVPHYYLTHTIDLGAAMDWLHDRNLELPVSGRLVAAVLLVKAAARAAAEVPELNGFWVDGAYRASADVHVGVAISLRGGGLIAPALHNADSADLGTLMSNLRDLVTRTRAGRLRGSELADATITVSNLGDQGIESIIGVIYPPQVALVGFGAILERPWAVNGLLGVRPTVVASLSGDHRATDGVTGARYLKTLERLLQRPEEL
jgi:pyruvate dehydrogenase E2 component (dihydrolipoyllysine-residue acetyltransferase)